jgi:D-lyxose ketol-isomerase
MSLTPEALQAARQRALDMLRQAGIAVTAREWEALDIADFALGDWEQTGLIELVYINTERYCAKELMLSGGQTCPEHRHPPVGGQEGKEETFRCRWGSVWLYVDGPPAAKPVCQAPKGSERYYTVWHEIALKPGDQYTIPPDSLHWFQAGPVGAIVSEFSTASLDETDVFTDPRITWTPQ